MLSSFTPTPTLAVKDLGAARTFYEDVLGLGPPADAGGNLLFRAGQSTILVYASAHAGTNKATALSFSLGAEDFDAEVSRLREQGVRFQTFEAEGITWDGDVAVMGDARAVWFADPDGNILNLETA